MSEDTLRPVADPPAERPPAPPGRAPLLMRAATLAVIVVPLLGLAAAPALLWGWGFSWTDLGLFLGMYLLTALGVTVGFLMLKRTGMAKVVDIGSAADLRSAEGRRAWSPLYTAPEVLGGGPLTPQSDLASLGYVLVEMLAGRPPFDAAAGVGRLRDDKQTLEHRLGEVLPPEVAGNDLLVGLCRRLVATDPEKRFPDAEAADLGRKGAAAFHRQLVQGNLASEYGNDIRVWLEALGPPSAEGEG